ncbi:RagB/SusD family nutrient uptake outer membrane protein [Aquimarina sp. D1M17]|uniref:RagB/SusD family nutrient uptake outer membrane protein n=1 Tax=Aquimarina acroporae TaxID=2937283 RepID=UPI0020BDBC0B|nr:RagB/SusD family nutrient uptake outer membrane protein [Aquimarina acroporae]MCK8521204.1 RagB/SusD family nutrient uptake outer membrane protein [Aquimarina acroporae]
MKLKNKLFLISILTTLLVVVNGCNEDQLELSNPNTVAEPDFFQTEADFRLAVNGMFHPVTAVLFWGRVVHTGALLRSDAYNIVPFQQNTTMSTLEGQPGIARWSSDMFPQLYQTIFRANTILEKINEENVPDENARNEIIGQAYFMRAFANWYLVNLWGNVPLVLKTPTTNEELFPSAATPAAINQAIIDDLTEAANRLPDSWADEDKGRPTAGSALALRGKTHLYIKDYPSAVTDFQAVVNNFGYQLLSAANYEQNFTEENENNVESVFELQFLGQANFIWGTDIPGTGTQGHYFIDYSPPNLSPDNGHFINPHILQVFEDNADEVRRNATIAFDYPGALGYGGVPFTEDFADDIAEAAQLGIPALFTKKYAGFEQGTREEIPVLGNTIGNNWRIIRYADVLLMLAEALNEDNRTPEAIPFINQVRERAQIAPLALSLSKTEVTQAIIDERVMELTGEGHRFFDLVRWELADDILGPGSTVAGGRHPKSLAGPSAVFTVGQDELLWIPVPELQANPNLRPNPGY